MYSGYWSGDRIIWTDNITNPQGPIYVWENGTASVLLPYGAVYGANDRGDVVFLTWADSTDHYVSWLYRNGAFYQPMDGAPDVLVSDINERGDVVGYGMFMSSAPSDVFIMYYDPLPADVDEDGDRDLHDLPMLAECLTGPVVPPDADCSERNADADGDTDVDLADAAALQTNFTGDCALAITTPPGGQSVCSFESATMSVDVRGRVASYQWTKNGEPIPGATGSSYTIPFAVAGHEGDYGVRLVSECGWEVKSDFRHWLRVPMDPPNILDQPQGRTICEGDDVQLCVFTPEHAFISYQWSKDGVPIPGADWTCYVIRDASPSDAGQYRCTVNNACGSTVSNPATVTVIPIGGPPVITEQPASQTVQYNSYAELEVIARCADSYQWYRDGLEIEGAHLPTYIIFPAQCDDEGIYHVRAYNAFGNTLSQAATIDVGHCP